MVELAEREPQRFLHLQADQAHAETPARVVHAVKERFGRLDALINNAAIATEGTLAIMQPQSVHTMIDINLTSVVLLTRVSIREFLRTPRSVPKTIINVSSIVGLTGFRGLSVYSATKSALLGLTRSLARELGPANITVNAVLPGFLATEMSHSLNDSQRTQIIRRTPLERLGETSDVTPVVRFLLGDGSRFVTGQCLIVDGGATC
jgi:3-oxoacyl-[acyl-carrier protein] reductase